MKTSFNDKTRDGIKDLLARVVSNDLAVANVANADFAQAVSVPLRETLLSGDIINGIYTPEDFRTNPDVRYPLDLLTPGDEAEFKAFVVPNQGEIPHARLEGDYLTIPTYNIGNGIDLDLQFIKDANWPVIRRALQIFEAGFVKKMNDDGWQCIISAANDRNVIVYDGNATQGQFTPRLITLLQNYMRRNGGGNSATMNRSRVTDVYMSPEAHMDIRAWGLDIVPDRVRENIYYAKEGSQDLINIFGVNLHALDEFGVNQEYQNYWTNTLSGSLSTQNDVEIAIALDQNNQDFVMPIREDLQVFEDNTVHRRGDFSVYGRFRGGFAVLDSRRTLVASL